MLKDKAKNYLGSMLDVCAERAILTYIAATTRCDTRKTDRGYIMTTLAVFTAYTITAFILMLAFGIIGIEIMLGAGIVGTTIVGAYHAVGVIMALAE